MNMVRNREIRGILAMVFVIFVLGYVMAGTSGKLEEWGLPWFTGAKALDRIIFVSDRSGTAELYSMNPDGSDQKQLTTGAKAASAPAVSSLGNRIAFLGSGSGRSQALAVGANGGSPEILAFADSQPGFSPDGKRLSYIASGKVEVADLSGQNPDPILPTHSEIHGAMANQLDRGKVPTYTAYAWGPDGNSMAGVTRDQSDNDILVYLPKLEGDALPLLSVAKDPSGDTFLTIMPKLGGQPAGFEKVSGGQNVRISAMAWAAKKPVLVVSAMVGDGTVILLFDADAGTFQPLAGLQHRAIDSMAVSPDGSSIAFAIKSSDKKSPDLIESLDIADLTAKPSLKALAEGTFASVSYSPKGDRVLAVKVDEENRTGDVVSIDPSTGEIKQLTTDGHSLSAAWTPESGAETRK